MLRPFVYFFSGYIAATCNLCAFHTYKKKIYSIAWDLVYYRSVRITTKRMTKLATKHTTQHCIVLYIIAL